MSRPRTTPKPPATLADIATARTIAERLFTSARGSLINTAQTYRHELPHFVALKLEEYERADDRLAAMKELHRSRTVAEHGLTGNLETSQRMARISALIAAHVMAARLVLVPDQLVYRWMTTDDNRKHRAVPSYAADAGAIDKALARVAEQNFTRLSTALSWHIGKAESAVAAVGLAAMLSPMRKALAILDTIDVRETDDPPTVAE